ncbi:HNH endonuclease [Lacticaseibacillus paracasei]|uniref:HNH endonuclease n=1 Tax=Lacticaseibacillus paracasei TaxID=1597 RepID=UPI0023AA0431|nr:HNH endonuclease [Lacticaseibacillus paracasei]MDE5158899.1 HNH endonuclease [Lacticaseibacillus paracasei]
METTCMFCGEKKESSIEHIIPKAIGNETLTTNNVCKDCNSALGATIDDRFVNSWAMQMERNRLSLKGYKGTVPNPMKNGTDEDGNQVILDKGQSPQYIPTIDDTGHSLAIRTSSTKKAYQIALKKLKRKNIPKEQAKEILKNSKVLCSDKIRPNISFEGQIDTEALKLEFLKIAFEYMNKEYGDMYRKDPIGNDLKNILNQFKSGNKVDYSKYLSDIPKGKITPLKNAIQRRGKNIHYIQFVLTDDKRLFMTILLFNGNYSQNVLVSNCGKEYPKISDKKIAVVIK